MSALAIEVKALVKRFDTVTAVNGISFEVPVGQCIGLLGPNGAGKTTTVEILEGLQPASSGEVRLLGMSWERDERALRPRLGLTLQHTQLLYNVSVEETLRLFRSFYPSGPSVDEVLDLVDLRSKRRSYTNHLSGGQAQRLSVGMALVGDPQILFLDEPTTGLDPVARQQLWTVIRDLRRRGRTVVLTTHYMDEVEKLCDRILIMNQGSIVADGSPAELIRSVGGEQLIDFTSEPPLRESTLRALPGFLSLQVRSEGPVLLVEAVELTLPALLKAVHEAGGHLTRLEVRRTTLDDVFLSLTGRSL